MRSMMVCTQTKAHRIAYDEEPRPVERVRNRAKWRVRASKISQGWWATILRNTHRLVLDHHSASG